VLKELKLPLLEEDALTKPLSSESKQRPAGKENAVFAALDEPKILTPNAAVLLKFINV